MARLTDSHVYPDGRECFHLSYLVDLEQWALFASADWRYLAGIDFAGQWQVYDCASGHRVAVMDATIFSLLIEPYRVCSCKVNVGCSAQVAALAPAAEPGWRGTFRSRRAEPVAEITKEHIFGNYWSERSVSAR